MISLNKNCIGCGLCVSECPTNALTQNDDAIMYNESRCMNCGHCFAVCKYCGIKLKTEKLYKDETVLSKIIANRRSVRKYKKLPVEEEVINKLIYHSSYYPSAINQKTVKFTVITDKMVIDHIRNEVISGMKKSFRMLNNPVSYFFAKIIMGKSINKVLRYKDIFEKMDKDKDLLTFAAPALIFVHGNKKDVLIDEDAHYAAHNFILLAYEKGLGTCFMGFIRRAINSDNKLKSVVKIPKDHNIYTVFTLGYPDVEYLREIPQEPIKYNLINYDYEIRK